MDIIFYYKHFKRIFMAIGGVISAIPLTSLLPWENLSRRAFPPLGGDEPLFALMTFVCLWLTPLLVYRVNELTFLRSKGGRRTIMAVLLLIVAAGYMSHVWARTMFVCSISSSQYAATVSIGFNRTEFAKKNFAAYDDCAMLRERGPSEAQVRKLWTAPSLALSRTALLTSYVSFLLGGMAILSFTVLFDAIDSTATEPVQRKNKCNKIASSATR